MSRGVLVVVSGFSGAGKGTIMKSLMAKCSFKQLFGHKKGDKIKAGTLLGYMGNTGYGTEGTTGCFDVHLHFGIYAKTKNYYELSYNPYCILKYLENNVIFASY